MVYVVETGDSFLREADDLPHAVEMAGLALQSADDFASRMGWAPFWADEVCVLQVRKDVWSEDWRDFEEIKKAGRVVKTPDQVRRALGMGPCPAPRPA